MYWVSRYTDCLIHHWFSRIINSYLSRQQITHIGRQSRGGNRPCLSSKIRVMVPKHFIKQGLKLRAVSTAGFHGRWCSDRGRLTG